MSNARPFRRRPRTSAQDDVARVLGPLDGARIAGGCDHCDAYQTTAPVARGVWTITVHHDDWCPTYRRHLAATATEGRTS